MLLILRIESWVGGPAVQRTLPPDHEFQMKDEGWFGTLVVRVETTLPSKRYWTEFGLQTRVYCALCKGCSRAETTRGTWGTIAYLVLARGGVGGVRDVRVRVLRVVTLAILIHELEAGVHGGVAGVEEGREELDVGLFAVVVVREKAGKACIRDCEERIRQI